MYTKQTLGGVDFFIFCLQFTLYNIQHYLERIGLQSLRKYNWASTSRLGLFFYSRKRISDATIHSRLIFFVQLHAVKRSLIYLAGVGRRVAVRIRSGKQFAVTSVSTFTSTQKLWWTWLWALGAIAFARACSILLLLLFTQRETKQPMKLVLA